MEDQTPESKRNLPASTENKLISGAENTGPKFSSLAMLKTRLLFKLRRQIRKEKQSEVGEKGEIVPRRFLFSLDSVIEESNDLSSNETESLTDLHTDIRRVVDQDENQLTGYVSQVLVSEFLESFPFRTFILILILMNSFMIGLQSNQEISQDYAYLFAIFDQIVLTVFVFEIFLKWFNDFWTFWKDGWNVFDFMIISSLLLGPSLTFLGTGRILRILRVVKAFRSVKSIGALSGLSLVIKTIFQSIPDMSNLVLLLLIILCVFGVAGVIIFGDTVPEHFDNLYKALFSLFICVTQEGWLDLIKDFSKVGGTYYIVGSLYFSFAVLIGALFFANLVVAVIVTNLELSITELKTEKKDFNKISKRDLTLMTFSRKTEEIEDTISGIVAHEEILGTVSSNTQAPLEPVTFEYLSERKLINYLMTLVALEENLAEYTEIRRDIDRIYDVVNDVQNLQFPFEELQGSVKKNMKAEVSQNLLEVTDLKGDIMSTLIRLQRKNLIKHGSFDLHNVIKECAQLVEEKNELLTQMKPKGVINQRAQKKRIRKNK
ncbi:cation channel sperm-associated protein 4-like [Limulus polyphemus]|uniref:Cation channel sperm-associated protein 4-like n=1 Tax=Limulus polyphemus TaxID=6850 RepID=A0ABM1BGX3_LIMPO|nr:cation channel sperm-associated protein 4-like [Limulus polyphemus]